MTTQITQVGGCWKIWGWKYACDAGDASWMFERRPGHCHHPAGRKNRQPTFEHTCPSHSIRCLKSYGHTCDAKWHLNSANVASQLTAHTVCKSLCHLSTFQLDRLKGDSHTPSLLPSLPPPFSLSPSFIPSFCVFVLDGQAVGWSVWPRWTLRLGWRKFTNG